MAWIKGICPVTKSVNGPNVKRIRAPSGNAKARRKQAYAQCNCINAIRMTEGVQRPGTNEMFDYSLEVKGRKAT